MPGWSTAAPPAPSSAPPLARTGWSSSSLRTAAGGTTWAVRRGPCPAPRGARSRWTRPVTRQPTSPAWSSSGAASSFPARGVKGPSGYRRTPSGRREEPGLRHTLRRRGSLSRSGGHEARGLVSQAGEHGRQRGTAAEARLHDLSQHVAIVGGDDEVRLEVPAQVVPLVVLEKHLAAVDAGTGHEHHVAP